MIDTFDKAQFEAALPVAGGRPLWTGLGLRDGEHCYVVPVKPGVLIYVRSSVDASGVCRESAKDSIRCWLASNDRGTALGSKLSRWVTRVPGWQARLTETLRAFWRLGRKLRPCPRCGAQTLAFKVKKAGENNGRFFAKCPNCDEWLGWLTEAKTQKESKCNTTSP